MASKESSKQPASGSKKPGDAQEGDGSGSTKLESMAGYQRYADVKDRYGKMSAKARGVRLHQGPLDLRHSLPARDCTSWVRSDRQYDPYSYFAQPGNKPPPKFPKSNGPPPLWLLPRAKDGKVKSKASEEKDGTGPAKSESPEKPGWDTEHHILFSRMNAEMQSGVREYFDHPKTKGNEGIPRLNERYVMNDRQCGWNDLPDKPGEMRRTLFSNVGPYNLGGCKEQQLPSYWRKIKDWGSYSTPELGQLAISRLDNLPSEKVKKHLLLSLANTPAHEAAEFWRSWADAHTKAENKPDLPAVLDPTKKRWDKNWSVTSSKDNDVMNPRQREYFSVPEGGRGFSSSNPAAAPCRAGTGRATEPPRTKSHSLVHPLSPSAALSMMGASLTKDSSSSPKNSSSRTPKAQAAH